MASLLVRRTHVKFGGVRFLPASDSGTLMIIRTPSSSSLEYLPAGKQRRLLELVRTLPETVATNSVNITGGRVYVDIGRVPNANGLVPKWR